LLGSGLSFLGSGLTGLSGLGFLGSGFSGLSFLGSAARTPGSGFRRFSQLSPAQLPSAQKPGLQPAMPTASLATCFAEAGGEGVDAVVAACLAELSPLRSTLHSLPNLQLDGVSGSVSKPSSAQRGLAGQRLREEMAEEEPLVLGRRRELPQLAPGLPQLAPGLPQLAPGLPQLAPGLPQLAPGLPQLAPGLPQLAPGLPQLAPGLPQLPHAVPAVQLPQAPQLVMAPQLLPLGHGLAPFIDTSQVVAQAYSASHYTSILDAPTDLLQLSARLSPSTKLYMYRMSEREVRAGARAFWTLLPPAAQG